MSSRRTVLIPKVFPERRELMTTSTYNIIELIGTSNKSWEEAAKIAIETAAKTLRDLRVAEVVKLDMTVENGKVTAYRARLNLSFKYEE
jgi:flavin-binding protein dodecin